MSGHRLHLCQDITYTFWYNLSPKKGENYDLEGNNNDGAENRVYEQKIEFIIEWRFGNYTITELCR